MRRRVAVEVLDSIFVLRGWQAHKLALEAGLRPTYSGVHQGWMADTAKLSTFEAYCAHRFVAVDVTGEQVAVSPEPARQDHGVHRGGDHGVHRSGDQVDAPLFDLGGAS